MLIFDLDGTLINSELYLKRIEAELKCELGHNITLDEQIERFSGMGPYQQLEIDPTLPRSFPAEAEKRFRARAQDNLQVCPGVLEFLDQHQGLKVIASNGPLEWIQIATQVTGLDRYFDSNNYFHVGLVKNRKPAPDLFLLAAKKANNSEKIIVIEDSLTGIKAGVAAQLTTLCYTGTSINPKQEELAMKYGAYSTFNNYSELSSLLQKID